MATYSNIIPTPEVDGVPYSAAVPITGTEADLGDSVSTPSPISVQMGLVIVAVVSLTVRGYVTANTTYVVMQVDMGDGVWVDVAWVVWTANQGSATFVMYGGGNSGSGSFQQSRQAGNPPTPQANGSNTVPLAGRVRFVGKSIFAGGSSSISGSSTSVLATIKYKLLTPR